jgi:uncharacterized protein with ParB-like and HNH nuclease domain
MPAVITPTYKTVQDLLKDEKFSIDDYQREYKWDKKQIEELITEHWPLAPGPWPPNPEP